MTGAFQHLERLTSLPGSDGLSYESRDSLNSRDLMALFEAVLKYKPEVVLEIGMAQGYSSYAIAAALQVNGRGRLISLDPFENTNPCDGSGYHGVGLELLRRNGLTHLHELVEEPDYVALPRLLESGLEIDFAYVDGEHLFDYVLLDFFYLDKMMKPGGLIGFSDCNLASVYRVIDFARTHRKYREVPRQAPRYGHGLSAVRRRIRQKPINDRYLEKVETWEPPWYFHVKF